MQKEKIHTAIKECWATRHICQQTLFEHCLPIGGAHMEESHVRLMLDCIQICQAAADFMTRGSPMHAAVCEACADICDACAKACARIGDEAMMRCAECCHACAKRCRDAAKVVVAA